MNSIITVGITGGIGTGKSLICRIINIMGYPVFYSDDQAKHILNSDPETIEQVKNLFGDQAYSENKLNRTHIANLVFSNIELLTAYNKIVHPKVRLAFNKWKTNQDSLVVFNEAAILFETGAYKNHDFNILVTSPLTLRIMRLINRDNTTEENIKARISKQWDDEKKIVLADFVVRNNETELLIPQIQKIIERLKK